MMKLMYACVHGTYQYKCLLCVLVRSHKTSAMSLIHNFKIALEHFHQCKESIALSLSKPLYKSPGKHTITFFK